MRLGSELPPQFQLFRFAAGVKNGQDHDAFFFDEKMNHERKAADNRAANFASDFGKQAGTACDTLKVFLDGSAKFLPQSFALALIPGDGIVKSLFRNATKDQTAFHLRYFASSLALISSHETTSSGLSRWSWRRRSISSASPGVSSCEPTIPSQRWRHNSICSTSGSARAALKPLSELITLIYRVSSPAQGAKPGSASCRTTHNVA